MLRNRRADEMIAAVDEEQFETVRRWGEGLRGDPREEVRAAGQAIVLLCAEVDRLERDLWTAKTTAFPDEPPTHEVEPELIETTLRDRMRQRVSGLYSRPARRSS
jgi:hypothetical protein